MPGYPMVVRGQNLLWQSPIEGPSHSEVIQDTLHTVRIKQNNSEFVLSDGSIVVAAITSCTNTSNPAVMVGAGLLARNAIEKKG